MNYCEFDDTSTTNVEMFIFITLLCAALASPLIFFFDRLLSKLYVDLESDPSFKDDLLEAELASRQAKKKKEEYKRKRNELKAQLKKQGLNKQEIKGKGRLRLVFFCFLLLLNLMMITLMALYLSTLLNHILHSLL